MRAALLMLLGCTSADPHERVACQPAWTFNGGIAIATCELGCEVQPVDPPGYQQSVSCPLAIGGDCSQGHLVTFDGATGCCREHVASPSFPGSESYVQFVECNP